METDQVSIQKLYRTLTDQVGEIIGAGDNLSEEDLLDTCEILRRFRKNGRLLRIQSAQEPLSRVSQSYNL